MRARVVVLDIMALFEKTVKSFRTKPPEKKLHPTAQRLYTNFSNNRTADLYTTFFDLVGGVPDYSESKLSTFTACVPFREERPVRGMAKNGVAHGLIRYEYKGNIVEETRLDGKEHGLRVVCTQLGDIWIRFFSKGKRLAQIVMSPSGKIGTPKPIDEGGLKDLRSNLHLIVECFVGKGK